MSKEKFINLEISGLIFTLLLGIILKYSIMMFGVNLWTMLIGSVNQSVWEGVKVFALSYLVWACLEYCMIHVPLREFIVSKVIGTYTLLLAGTVLFSIISNTLKGPNALIDTFMIFIVICLAFGASYKMMLSEMKLDDWFVLSLFCIALFFAMYFCFVMSPPHIDPFMDKNTCSYGIEQCI